MLKIGTFSKLSRLSIRMLRRYDELGLLQPVHTDPFTGYRYYREEQLTTAGRIAALRDMGFGLSAIGALLEDCLLYTSSGRPLPWGRPIWPVWPPGCGAVPASCAACGGATPPSPPPCRRSSGSACWSSGTGRWAAAGTGPGRKSTHLPFFPFLYPLVIWAAVG